MQKYTMIDPIDLLTGKATSFNKYTTEGPWIPAEEPPVRKADKVPESKIVMLLMEINGGKIETPGWYNHKEQQWYVWGLYAGGEIIGWAKAR